MGENHRRASGAGRAVITIDVRAETTFGATDTSYWTRVEHLLPLLGLMSEIAGPDAEIFFDFGVLTIREVDLSDFAERITGRSET